MASKLLSVLRYEHSPFNGLGNIGNPGASADAGPVMLEKVISTILGVITIFGGIWFIIQLFIGTFNWISAGGDKSSLERAQKRITNAIIGLFLVVFAYGLAALVGKIIGLNLLEPALILPSLHP